MFPDSHHTVRVLIFSYFVRFASCCTTVVSILISILKIFKSLQTINTGLQISQASENVWKVLKSYSELLSKFGTISFQEYIIIRSTTKVYKIWRVRGEANFISSGSKIVKRLRRRQYEPAIIERTKGLVLGPSTALYR